MISGKAVTKYNAPKPCKRISLLENAENFFWIKWQIDLCIHHKKYFEIQTLIQTKKNRPW